MTVVEQNMCDYCFFMEILQAQCDLARIVVGVGCEHGFKKIWNVGEFACSTGRWAVSDSKFASPLPVKELALRCSRGFASLEHFVQVDVPETTNADPAGTCKENRAGGKDRERVGGINKLAIDVHLLLFRIGKQVDMF